MVPPYASSHGQSRARCTSAGRVTAQLLLSFLALSAAPFAAADNRVSQDLVLPLPPTGPILAPPDVEPPTPADHVFTLRHIYHHGAHLYPNLHRKQDVSQHEAEAVWLAAEDGFDRQRLPVLRAKSQASTIQRLVDRRPSVVDPMVALARELGSVTMLSPSAWTMDSVATPNITDKETVLSMAYMAANAYVEAPGMPDWEEVGRPFNRSADFGWAGDGLRGHVFADEHNSTIVIGLKGTSLAVFDGEGTTTNDKENDNLFFSCCCAQQGQWTYRQVCNCATATYACNNTCVRQALRDENRYYMAARELYSNISALYPGATVWMTGHSLGGAISSFLGLTYGLPVVTFQAVPEAKAVGLLGLPVPPGADPDNPQTRDYTGAYHFGHTADPIYMGTCNGATASCSYAGYALETSCHSGFECVYDVVADKGWRVGVGTHRIRTVISDVLIPYEDVPVCQRTPECRDCVNWRMYESNGTDGTTTSSSSSSTMTRTRTQTCQTPGWWGCLDETTTTATATTTTGKLTLTTATTTTSTTSTTTTTTTTTTSTTCKTPGRFWGCLDELTTAPTVTTTRAMTMSTTPLSSTSKSTTARSTTLPVATSSSASAPSSTSCLTPGFFWGCRDITTETTALTHTITAPPSTLPVTRPTATATSPVSKQHCVRRGWFGICKDWESIDDL